MRALVDHKQLQHGWRDSHAKRRWKPLVCIYGLQYFFEIGPRINEDGSQKKRLVSTSTPLPCRKKTTGLITVLYSPRHRYRFRKPEARRLTSLVATSGSRGSQLPQPRDRGPEKCPFAFPRPPMSAPAARCLTYAAWGWAAAPRAGGRTPQKL